MKTNSNTRLLPFPVISAAANGDTEAICAILKHYEGYIARLCTRTLKDDAGNAYSYVDEEMKNRLQVRLITRTLAFHVGELFQPMRKRVPPFPRFPLWAMCRSAKAYRCRCVFAGRQSLCTLTKNARKITAAQYKRQTNTYYLYRAKRRVRHDRFSP